MLLKFVKVPAVHGWHDCAAIAIEPDAQAVQRSEPSELILPASQGVHDGERSNDE